MRAGSESETTRVIRGRNFASCDLVIARRLVGEYFREGRLRIATELAEHWQWRSRSGRLKVRAALAILVTLERGGHLQLPPPLIVHGPVRDTGDWACATPPGTDLTDGLGHYLPLYWQLADSAEQRRQWRGVLARHHYLGAPGLVGAHLQYLVYGASGELLAALGWQSAVERLDCRDQLVGVSGRADWRARFLIHAVNNVRFLVLPWVRVRHLASAVLGKELHEFIGEFDDTFGRIEPAGLCRLYVQGLLSGTARKNVEAMALGLESPKVVRNLQRFISEYEWNEGRMRDRHWQLSAQSLADEQGVWSVDASEFPKKGKESVGVAPQYCGALGKTANCQSGVFICYSGPKGHALLNARLYLPQCWFSEAHRERRQEKCRVPKEVVFQTKPQIALELCSELWKTRLFPGQWVTCDASFGNNETFLAQLPEGMLYLAKISCTRKVWLKHAPQHPAWEIEGGTVEQLVEEKDLLHWQSRKIAEGEKGPIVASFARVRVYLSPQRTPESERTLLLRNDPDGRIKYALSNAPESVTLSELIRVSAARWPIERCFQEDKSELGLDHYEHRSWAAWHRHMRLVFLAHLFLTRLRLKYKKSPGPDVADSFLKPEEAPPLPGLGGLGAGPGSGGLRRPANIRRPFGTVSGPVFFTLPCL